MVQIRRINNYILIIITNCNSTSFQFSMGKFGLLL